VGRSDNIGTHNTTLQHQAAKETYKHCPHGHDQMTSCEYRETMTTAKKKAVVTVSEMRMIMQDNVSKEKHNFKNSALSAGANPGFGFCVFNIFKSLKRFWAPLCAAQYPVPQDTRIS